MALARSSGSSRRLPLALCGVAFLAYNIVHWWAAPGDDWSSIWVAAAMVAGGRADLLYTVDPQRFTDVGDPAARMSQRAGLVCAT